MPQPGSPRGWAGSRYPTAIALALRLRAGVAHSRGHVQEAGGLLAQALKIALEHEVLDQAATCYFWVSDRCFQMDAYAEALGYLDDALTLTRRNGDRPSEWGVLAERTHPLCMLGRWDEVLAIGAEFTEDRFESGGLFLSLFEALVEIHLRRGRLDAARGVFPHIERLANSSDTQELSTYFSLRGSVRLAEGKLEEALVDGRAAIEAGRVFGITSQSSKRGLVDGLEAAFALGDEGALEELLTHVDSVPSGTRSPYLDAQARRFRARMAGDAAGLAAAVEQYRRLELPFWLAVTLLETGGDDQIAEALTIFERLGATPWIERAHAAGRQAQPA